jgi:type IV secretion system protein VirD4
VLVSGQAPIRAGKVRYYEDGNFTGRVLPPPALAEDGYADRPAVRPDDWTGSVARPDRRLAPEADPESEAAAPTEGGRRQQPELAAAGPVLARAPEPEPDDDLAVLDDGPSEAELKPGRNPAGDGPDRPASQPARRLEEDNSFAAARRATVLDPADGIFPNP